MRTLPLGLLLVSGVCAVWAQTKPVVLPRGIVNALTQLPAPAFVGRGGIVQINGLNLGPPVGLKATGSSLPTQLGDVQVLINGRAALFGGYRDHRGASACGRAVGTRN